jgi:hypothetical protein
MQLIELGIRVMLGAVFAIAAAGKLRSRAAFDAFVDTIPAYRNARADRLASVAAVVIAAELVAVVLLIVCPLAGLVMTSGLLGAFATLMIVTLRAGTPMVCRCFGAHAEPVGRGHVVRNAVLLLAGAVAAAARWSGSAGGSGVDAAMAVVVIAVAAILGVLISRWDDLVFMFRPVARARATAGEVRW